MPLDELRRVERATVLKGGAPAAVLERRTDAIVFAYQGPYLVQGGPPVATSLPLSDIPVVTHSAGALPPFFSGLLPEGRRLSALREAVKTSADDELTLLLAVGADVVGDVQIIPEGVIAPTEVEPRIVAESWSEVRFSELFARSVGGGGAAIDRVAIPGVQAKLSAGVINVPVARKGHRYILKLDPPEYPNLVANEAFFLDAARSSGVETAEAEVVWDAEGLPGLLVRRFDRTTGPGGAPLALAQEDGCQVLRRYPADKYRVTAEEVIDALASVCQARPVAALALLRQVAFAYLSGNGDAHAKNFSVRRLPGGEWRVCPAYDLPSTYLYGDTTMALPLNGRDRENIGRRDFLAAGETLGLRSPPVERMLNELLAGAERWIGDLARLPFDKGKLLKLRRAIDYRRERLAG
jgi:serine/threonine-protein kinase HipA